MSVILGKPVLGGLYTFLLYNIMLNNYKLYFYNILEERHFLYNFIHMQCNGISVLGPKGKRQIAESLMSPRKFSLLRLT